VNVVCILGTKFARKVVRHHYILFIIIIISIIIIIIIALEPFLGPLPRFQFLNPIHSRRRIITARAQLKKKKISGRESQGA
jgi:hypothetical protein